MPKPDIAYVALASRDCQATCAFLGANLGLTHFTLSTSAGQSHDAYRVGATALVVFAVDDPFLTQSRPGVDHIALATGHSDPMLDFTGLPRTDIDLAGLDGRSQAAIAPSALSGVHIRLTQPITPQPDATNQSSPVERIDHLGIASRDNPAAEHNFITGIGAIYESRQTDLEISSAIESFTSDKYGAVYHARPPRPVGGLSVSFLSVGDTELEFLQDFDPDPEQGLAIDHGAPGTTKQDQSAIGRYIAKHGPGLHHIAFKVGDIDATLSHLQAAGHRMIDLIGRPGSRRARIGFIHPSTTGGILFHLVERNDGR